MKLSQWAISFMALLLGACGGSTSSSGPTDAGTGANGGGGGTSGTGGGGGTGAVGGLGGGGPITPTSKIDLLLMVDNSVSMADKQEILAASVPRLLQRLTAPQVDPATGKPEIEPVTDLHIGVISSSLGGHGGDQCVEGGPGYNPTQNDYARLMPSVRPGLPSYQNLGFLWWAPGSGGETDVGKLGANFQVQVTAVGEQGCGYESQLEAWYRFLVDPAPPAFVAVVNNNAQLEGIDDVVLQQRNDFLRPDSAVVVIMLTDENDCSIVDGSYYWIAAQISNPNGQPFHLPRGTAACDVEPNSACCRSCATAEVTPPAGCQDLGSDPSCQKGSWDDLGDHPNLRCWQQKRRFGQEFLYPTRRYVEALTQPTICPTWDADGPVACGQRSPNPLLLTRDPRLVFLTGIVGVPWQDLATEATLSDPSALELKRASELNWSWLVPSCAVSANPAELPRPMAMCDQWDLADPPDDPLLVESTAPRTGANPATGNALAPPGAGALANPINGHEWNTHDGNLQYACIFKLAADHDCGTTTAPACDCDDVGAGYDANNPLCQDGPSYSKVQRFAKAYPGLRQLEVLKDIGDQAVVASICAKASADTTSSAYGYNAAMAAVVRQIAPVLVK